MGLTPKDLTFKVSIAQGSMPTDSIKMDLMPADSTKMASIRTALTLKVSMLMV